MGKFIDRQKLHHIFPGFLSPRNSVVLDFYAKHQETGSGKPSEAESLVAFMVMFEVKLCTTLLCKDTAFSSLHGSQNSVISTAQSHGDQGRCEASLAEDMPAVLRGKPREGPVYRVLLNKALCLSRSL